MYTVDIELFELNENTRKWEMIQCLGSNMENKGSAEVTIPNLGRRQLQDPFSPVVIGVGLSSAARSTDVLKALETFGLRTFKYTPVRYFSIFPSLTPLNRAACIAWSQTQSENIGDEIMRRLPPCPTRLSDMENRRDFREEKLSSNVHFVGTIQDYLGTTVIDDAFRTFFHPRTDKCFRQIVRSR